MAVTNDEAWDIVNACNKAKVKLMVGCDRRFWTHNQWAKQLIDAGVIGKLLMSRASLHEHWYNYQNHVADYRLPAARRCGRRRGGQRHGRPCHRPAHLAEWQQGQARRRRRQAHGHAGQIHPVR